MKGLLLLLLCFYLCACQDKPKEQESFVKLVDIFPQVVTLVDKQDSGDVLGASQLLDTLHKESIPTSLIDDTISLIKRAKLSGYNLVLPNSKLIEELDEYVIIATLPRGIYNLGLIPQSKHFEFTVSPSANDDGSEWNWEADGLSRPQKEFIDLLGNDKNAKILFYDSGEYTSAPMGNSHVGILWAKHLGYTQLYRLVGGIYAWKLLGLPLTTQVPHCCEM